MGVIYRNGESCFSDVVLGTRKSKALMRVTETGKIRCVRALETGERIPMSNLGAGYVFSHVVLHGDDTVTLYVKSINRLLRLFIIYMFVAAGALFMQTAAQGIL